MFRWLPCFRRIAVVRMDTSCGLPSKTVFTLLTVVGDGQQVRRSAEMHGGGLNVQKPGSRHAEESDLSTA